MRVPCRLTNKCPSMRLADLSQCLSGKRSIRNLAIVSGKPSFANFLFKLSVWINRGQIVRAPGARIKTRKH